MLPSGSRRRLQAGRACLSRRAACGALAAVAALLVLASRLWGGPWKAQVSTQIWRPFAPETEPAASLPEDSEDFLSAAALRSGAFKEDSGKKPSQRQTGILLSGNRHTAQDDSEADDSAHASPPNKETPLDGFAEGASTIHRLRRKSTVDGPVSVPLAAAFGSTALHRSRSGSGKWRQFEREARSKAEAFCRSDRYKAMEGEGHAGYRLVESSTHITPMRMFVLGGKDFVSESIARAGMWDIDKALEMVRLMGEVRNVKGRHDVAFMDVGANVGWFTFVFASRNISVIAFEAMPGNQDAIMGTLCLNPQQGSRVELHRLALGDRRQSCVLYAHRSNLGNGQIKCMAPELRASWELPPDMEGKGDVEMYRLDQVPGGRDLDVGIAKMDVEGYEGWVLEGGRETLGRLQIPYIITEFTRGGLTYRGFDPARFLEVWDELGYDVRKQCSKAETAIRVDRTAKQQCGGNATCLAEAPHIKFASSDEAEGADLCCVLRSYSQERDRVSI